MAQIQETKDGTGGDLDALGQEVLEEVWHRNCIWQRGQKVVSMQGLPEPICVQAHHAQTLQSCSLEGALQLRQMLKILL